MRVCLQIETHGNLSILRSNFSKILNNTWFASNVSWKSRNFSKIDDGLLTEEEVIAAQLCHGLLGTIGFLENLGVILVILFHRSGVLLDFPCNWFVLSLGTIDALTCLVTNLVVNIYYIAQKEISILITMVRFVAHCGSSNLLLLTFNRFLSVYSSLRYPAIMTVNRAKRLVLIPWIIGFLLCSLYECSRWAKLPNMTYAGGTYYGTVILSTAALNIYIFKQAREKSKVIKQLQTAVLGKQTASSKKEYRLAIRLLIVSVTFFASAVVLMISARRKQNEEARESVSFCRLCIWGSLLLQLNCIIDPIIYSINQPIFRTYFGKVRNRLSGRNKILPSPAVKIYAD